MNKEKRVEYAKTNRKTFYERHKEKVKGWVLTRKKEIGEWFLEYKKTLKCSRCPENHPACLDFHHKDPKKKDMMVSEAVNNGWSKQRILDEISKCDILCANCHRKEHYDAGKWTGAM